MSHIKTKTKKQHKPKTHQDEINLKEYRPKLQQKSLMDNYLTSRSL